MSTIKVVNETDSMHYAAYVNLVSKLSTVLGKDTLFARKNAHANYANCKQITILSRFRILKHVEMR